MIQAGGPGTRTFRILIMASRMTRGQVIGSRVGIDVYPVSYNALCGMGMALCRQDTMIASEEEILARTKEGAFGMADIQEKWQR
jgi:hypothetical protein